MLLVTVLLVILVLIFDALVVIWWYLSRNAKPLSARIYKDFCIKHALKVRAVGYSMAALAMVIAALCFTTWYTFYASGTSEKALLILGFSFGFASVDLVIAIVINQKYQVFE